MTNQSEVVFPSSGVAGSGVGKSAFQPAGPGSTGKLLTTPAIVNTSGSMRRLPVSRARAGQYNPKALRPLQGQDLGIHIH
jgi:hypothetical protein